LRAGASQTDARRNLVTQYYGLTTIEAIACPDYVCLVMTFGASGGVKRDFSTMKNLDPEYAMGT
jgi:hypothetical protein